MAGTEFLKAAMMQSLDCAKYLRIHTKGLETPRLMGSAVVGFNHAKTITKASATGLDARQDDYNNGICSPGS